MALTYVMYAVYRASCYTARKERAARRGNKILQQVLSSQANENLIKIKCKLLRDCGIAWGDKQAHCADVQWNR